MIPYRGAKSSIANQILDIIQPAPGAVFYDICCGSGSVSLSLLNRGWRAEDIFLVDAGPWGRVWEAFGKGFNASELEERLRRGPVALSLDPPGDPYTFLVLQAASMASQPVYIESDRWVVSGLGEWPTKRPALDTLLERAMAVAALTMGVSGIQCDARSTPWNLNRPGVIYIDPPYADSPGYGPYVIDLQKFLGDIPFDAWVSETKPLTGRAHQLPTQVRGRHRRTEFLSHFHHGR